MYGKIKAIVLERGEDPNQPLDPTKYPPLSGPLPGKEGNSGREKPSQMSNSNVHIALHAYHTYSYHFTHYLLCVQLKTIADR